MPRLLLKLLLWVAIALGSGSDGWSASGMFPKMPLATNVFAVDTPRDSRDGKMVGWALEGLINQNRAEVYVLSESLNESHYRKLGHMPHVDLKPHAGADGGLRALFEKYQTRVKKMIVYDPQKDWTWYLALMMAARQDGIPVTEAIKEQLVSEFQWNGEVEDYRNRWGGRIEAYDWALKNLMPGCNHQVLFVVEYGKPLADYVAASRGFAFWLDFGNPAERAEAEKIFSCGAYTVWTSLMGYANQGDSANAIANKYGIGYVVSDLYRNGSYWASFPNQTFQQRPGSAIKATPGRIYVAITWSDGDNVQFDENAIYLMWHNKDRGSVPVGTPLSPSLQELNPRLLNWYYQSATTNDELLAGPSGVQFIYVNDYNEKLFPDWCKTNRAWMDGAGFRTACVWHTTYPSEKYSEYIATCGLTGILNSGNSLKIKYDAGVPILGEGDGAWKETDIFDRLSRMPPSRNGPVFVGVKCIVAGFIKNEAGYTNIKRQVDRLNAAYPGRFVFLLPKDLFATIRSYCKLPESP